MIEDAGAPGPSSRQPVYSVAVLDAQYETMNPQELAARAMGARAHHEAHRLEGPSAKEPGEASEAA